MTDAALTQAIGELADLPADLYWIFAKGRLTLREPLWAVRITDQAGLALAEAEGDTPVDAVRKAKAALLLTIEPRGRA
jgi:hypothetical protein